MSSPCPERRKVVEVSWGRVCVLGRACVLLCVALLCGPPDVLRAEGPSTSSPARQQEALRLRLRRAFLGLDKCNACAGTSICKKLFKDEIRFDWWMSPNSSLPWAGPQTFPGSLTDDSLRWRPVVLSFLSSPRQHSSADLSICRWAGRAAPCSIEAVLRATPRFHAWRHAHLLLPHMVQGLAPPLVRCPSQRLLRRVVRRYAEVADVGSVQMKHFSEKDKLRLLYTLAVNQHPLILQMFPGTEGWPFPRYHGSCGRLAVWASSRPLSGLYGEGGAPLELRADAAYQLLRLTRALGARLGFLLYFTRLDQGTFARLDDGSVFIADASSLGVIDLEQGTTPDPPPSAALDEDIFSCLGQGSSPCPQAPPCSSVRPSQSLTLLCRHLLPRLLPPTGATDTQTDVAVEAGLLRDVPSLLSVCADSSLPDWRILGAAAALMERLAPLRPCAPRLAYRFPECRYSQGY